MTSGDPPESGSSVARVREIWIRIWQTVRRAFVEFLTIPTLVIAGFIVLALLMFVLDEARIVSKGHDSKAMWGGLFSDAQATRDFLGVIAGSIITVTSITLSLLLIAVQQGAASLTSLVFDQFLRRRTNQLYFGFFIGLALYSLIVLTSITPFHQPIYGVALAGVMTLAALYMLIILIYTTIDQMRPVVIIKSIHDHTLTARRCQLALLRTTRRTPRIPNGVRIRVGAERSGFVTGIDVTAITTNLPDAADSEVVVLVSVGDYVALGDAVAEIRWTGHVGMSDNELSIRNAVVLEQQRNLDTDPAFGVEQLVTIGWTSISTAKSNPDPGLLTIYNMRDLLARWLRADPGFGVTTEIADDPDLRVVYTDNLPDQLLRGFESLAVVASESMQHQSAAEIYRTFASLFDRLPPLLRLRVEDLLLRSLSGLGDHILTSELEASISALIGALTAAGQTRTAGAMATARRQLELNNGRLSSRGNRTGQL